MENEFPIGLIVYHSAIVYILVVLEQTITLWELEFLFRLVTSGMNILKLPL